MRSMSKVGYYFFSFAAIVQNAQCGGIERPGDLIDEHASRSSSLREIQEHWSARSLLIALPLLGRLPPLTSFLHTQIHRRASAVDGPPGLVTSPSPGDVLVSQVKGRHQKQRETGTAKTSHSFHRYFGYQPPLRDKPDTVSLICLLPAALFWYWQPVAVAQFRFPVFVPTGAAVRFVRVTTERALGSDSSTRALTYLLLVGTITVIGVTATFHLLCPGLFPVVTISLRWGARRA